MGIFESKVEINVNEYIQLKMKEQELDNILNSIMAEAELNYNKEKLTIKSDETLMNYLKIVESKRYNEKFDELGGEKDD